MNSTMEVSLHICCCHSKAVERYCSTIQRATQMQGSVNRVSAATGISNRLLVHYFIIMQSGFDTCLLVAADPVLSSH